MNYAYVTRAQRRSRTTTSQPKHYDKVLYIGGICRVTWENIFENRRGQRREIENIIIFNIDRRFLCCA